MSNPRWSHDDWVTSGLVESMPGWGDNERGHGDLRFDPTGQLEIFYMSREQEDYETMDAAWGSDYMTGYDGRIEDHFGPYPDATFPPPSQDHNQAWDER